MSKYTGLTRLVTLLELLHGDLSIVEPCHVGFENCEEFLSWKNLSTKTISKLQITTVSMQLQVRNGIMLLSFKVLCMVREVIMPISYSSLNKTLRANSHLMDSQKVCSAKATIAKNLVMDIFSYLSIKTP